MGRLKMAIWPILTLLGLGLAALGYWRGGGSAVCADGLGTGKYVMLVGHKGGSPPVERMYLVDTDKKVILVYESRNLVGTKLVGGRTYDQDFAILDKYPELVFKSGTVGYSARYVRDTFLKE
ncbi:MAG: hypothetical protein N3A38_00015 [Planctomycetota bacterium]|nr:hypothetical protein [Planctomycetota bacterium]